MTPTNNGTIIQAQAAISGCTTWPYYKIHPPVRSDIQAGAKYRQGSARRTLNNDGTIKKDDTQQSLAHPTVSTIRPRFRVDTGNLRSIRRRSHTGATSRSRPAAVLDLTGAHWSPTGGHTPDRAGRSRSRMESCESHPRGDFKFPRRHVSVTAA